MNIQQPEKQVRSLDGGLEVHSIFHTIQGEGPFAGRRAVFVRLAGCNLQCPLCDTEYTKGRIQITPAGIIASIRQRISNAIGNTMASGYLVVITGGEPFRQNIKPLVTALLDAEFRVQIETNGTFFQDLPYGLITVVCSPKTGTINKDLISRVDALKYIVKSGNVSPVDGLPLTALDHPAQPQLARPLPRYGGEIYIQPADEQDIEKNRKNTAEAVKSALQFGYILQLQIHKLIGVE